MVNGLKRICNKLWWQSEKNEPNTHHERTNESIVTFMWLIIVNLLVCYKEWLCFDKNPPLGYFLILCVSNGERDRCTQRERKREWVWHWRKIIAQYSSIIMGKRQTSTWAASVTLICSALKSLA